MAMVQRTTDVTPGTPVGDVRAAVMTDLSARATNASLKRRSNRELIGQRRMESILRALPSTNREAFQWWVCSRSRPRQLGGGLQLPRPPYHAIMPARSMPIRISTRLVSMVAARGVWERPSENPAWSRGLEKINRSSLWLIKAACLRERFLTPCKRLAQQQAAE